MRGAVATALCRRADGATTPERLDTAEAATTFVRSFSAPVRVLASMTLMGPISPLRKLTFRELEAFPRAGLTGLFALLHARIPAEQTLSFQRASEIAIDLKKGACDRKLRGTGLPHDATAGGVNRQIVSIYCLGSLKRLQHDVL